MGELLRRYWHPVGLAADAGATPRPVRVLGEDLILFRDGQGRPGLVHPRCAHRGASLYYGRVEADGIRCCYHGWMFRSTAAASTSRASPRAASSAATSASPGIRSRSATAWCSPTSARRSRKPLLPRIDVLEQLGAGESLEADDTSLGGGGPPIIPCNWLQHWENVVDSLHVPILHGVVLGPPVRAGDGADARGRVARRPSAACASTSFRDARRRPAPAPRHRGGDADAAGRAEPAPRQLRPGRVDRLGAADRRRRTSASTSPAGSSSRATSAGCARR